MNSEVWWIPRHEFQNLVDTKSVHLGTPISELDVPADMEFKNGGPRDKFTELYVGWCVRV